MDLLSYQSPPESRNSRIGFHEEPRIIEFQEAEASPLPSARKVPVSPLAAVTSSGNSESNTKVEKEEYSDEFSDDEKVEKVANEESDQQESKNESYSEPAPEPESKSEVEADKTPKVQTETNSETSPVKAPESISMENLVVEENGKFSVTGSNVDHQSPISSDDDDQQSRSRLSNHDPNPDYKVTI